MAVLANAFKKKSGKTGGKVETSLIEEFSYPKLGPGQLWDVTAEEIRKKGGTIITGAKVVKINKTGDHLSGVTYLKDGKEVTLDHSQTILCRNNRTRLVKRGWRIVSLSVHGVVFQYPCLMLLLTTCDKLHKSGIDTFQSTLTQRFLLFKDATAFIVEVKNVFDGLPFLIDVEETVFLNLFCMSRYWKCYWQSFTGKLTKETLATGVCTVVGSVQDAPVKVIAVSANVSYPSYIGTTLVFADWLAVLV